MQRWLSPLYFIADIACIIVGVCGLPVLADGVVVIDNLTATFEGSSFNFTCTDGLSPTAIIRTDCTAEGHWRPDPATHVCINISVTTTTEGMYFL